MKRKITLFILFLVFLAAVILVTLNMEERKALGVKDFHKLESTQEQKGLKILGKIIEITFDSFTIADIDFPEDEATFTFEREKFSLEEYNVGDAVLITISQDEYTSEMKAIEIQKIDIKSLNSYLFWNKPIIDINVIKFSNNFEEGIDFEIELINKSNRIISYENIYNENYGYTLIYELNNKQYTYHPVQQFESLEPEETKIINVLIENGFQEGENSIQFIWVKKSLYEEDFLKISSSEIFEFKL